MLDISSYTLIAATLMVILALVAYIAAVTIRAPRISADRAAHKVPVRTGAPGEATGTGLELGADGIPTIEHLNVGPVESSRPRGLAHYGHLLALGAAILLTVSLITRAIATGHGPFANQHEFAVSFGWGVLVTYLWFEWRHHALSLAVFVLPIAAAMLLYASTVDSDAKPLIPALQNNLLLTLHVATAILAYGAAAVAFAAGVLYLLRDKIRWHGVPSAARLDEIGYRGVVVAFPMMTVMIILGAIWADIAWNRYWSWDPKETAALVTWLIYGAYLHARVVRDWRGQRAAWLLIIGFAAVLFTYFGNLFFGGLHSYA